MRVPTQPLLAAFAAAGLATAASAQTISGTVLVENATNSVFSPSVAADGGVSVMTFVSDNRVQSSRSTDNGATWSSPVFVDDDAAAIGTFKTAGTQGDRPTLYMNGNNVYQVWETNRNGANDLYFAKSIDGGATWEPEIRLDDSVPMGTAGAIRDFAVVVSDNGGDDAIYVLLTVDPGDPMTMLLDEEIYLVNSQDSGDTFSSAVSASTENGNADVDSISIFADGSDVHIVWVDNRAGGTTNDVFYRRSSDGGTSWDFDEVQLDSSGPLNGTAAFPSIDGNGTTIAIGWNEQLGATVDQNRVAVSTDGGDTFGADVFVGSYTANLHDPDFFSMRFASNGTLVAAWDDDRLDVGMSDQVFATYSLDGGATWAADQQVSTAPGGFVRLVNGNDCNMALAWSGNDGGTGEEARAAGTVDGQLWSAAFTVSNNTADVDFVEMGYDGSTNSYVAGWLADDLGLNNDAYAATFSGDVAGAGFRNTTNPAVYAVTGAPILGGVFAAEVNVGAAGQATALLIGFDTAATFTLGGGQVLLCLDFGNGELLTGAGLPPTGVAGGIASFSGPVPNNPAFNGLKVCTQAIMFGAPPFSLSNAQDWVVGSY